jgi:hypothetical protein
MSPTAPPSEKPRRRVVKALRSLHPAAASALTLALLIGGAGLADAATGGNFILGKANKESTTASLASSRKTPLALVAPSGVAPLSVNRSVMVKNLNASYVGGLNAAQLATGGDGIRTTSIAIAPTQVEVAGTGPLLPGTYYVTATAWVDLIAGDNYGLCYVARGSAPFQQLATGGGNSSAGGHLQAAETLAVTVKARDRLQEWCYAGGSNGSAVINAGITAIRILSSSGGTPAG